MRRTMRKIPRFAGSAILALLWFPAALLTACPAPVVTDQRPGEDELPQDGNLSLSLRVMVVDKEANKEHLLTENESLYSGDGVYFLVRTSQPAYVYVVLFDPAGKVKQVFPAANGGVRRIGGRCPALRVPSEDTVDLQQPARRRDLRVVASIVPLGQANRRLCEQLQLPCQEPVDTVKPECPGAQRRSFFAAVKVANATPNGVASLRLTLNHDQ